MKKHLIIALVSSLLLMSCANETLISEHQHLVRTYGADFTKYTALGFQITPESYMGQYESIAMLNLDIYPQVIHRSFASPIALPPDRYEEHFIDNHTWLVEDLSLTDAIDSLYHLATKLGANSIVRFKIDVLPRKDGPLDIDGIQLSGFAIRKLKNNSRVLTD
jgi:hypothetical protein